MRGKKSMAVARPLKRQAIWDAIRTLGKDGASVPLRSISAESGVNPATCTSYLQTLVAGGYLGKTAGVAAYTLLRDTGHEAPRLLADGSPSPVGRVQEQMWRTMKLLGWWSVRDLVVAASTEDCPVLGGAAKSYVYHLHQAGYLQAATGVPTRYRLLPGRNTGPKPPVVTSTRVVFDSNLNALMWHGEVDA